jgi:anthranilate phosphoribosyltransferase
MTVNGEAIIERLIRGEDLDAFLTRELLEQILSGAMPPAQIAAALVLLRTKRESAIEIAEVTRLIIDRAKPIFQPSYLFADIVGTGGDGHHTINASTLASITAASLGLPVAKHGNVSVSSKCGSADVLRELGIDISLGPKEARASLDGNNWCFLYAPLYHTAFNVVKGIRSELKIRTIFNIIGPLANPMKPPIMVIGVFDPLLMLPFAEALRSLLRKRALIVHGSGLDEVALHGPTSAALLDDQRIETFTIEPKDLGLRSFPLEAIKGGEPKDNARMFKEILSGQGGEAKISMVSASAGALLWLGEKASSLREGVQSAKEALLAGTPMKTLNLLQGFGHGT